MRRGFLESWPQFGPLLLRFPVSYAFSCRVRMRSPVHGGRSFTWASCPMSELQTRNSCHAQGLEFGHSANIGWLGTTNVGKHGEQPSRNCRVLSMWPIVSRGGSASGNDRSMSRLWIVTANSSIRRRVARTDAIRPSDSGDGCDASSGCRGRSSGDGCSRIPKANHASADAVKGFFD